MQTGISLYVRHLSLLLIAWEVGERGIVVKAAMVPIGLNYWTDASMIGMLLVVNFMSSIMNQSARCDKDQCQH